MHRLRTLSITSLTFATAGRRLCLTSSPLILLTNNKSINNLNMNRMALFEEQQVRLAGHNKWSKIRHKKKVTDGEKMKKLGKCSKEITSAIRESNGDTDLSTNLRLRLILDKARKMNMPKTVIDRAMKAASDKDAAVMERVLYEGTGPAGVGFVIECLTDKRTRTAQNMRIAFKDNRGTMGTKTMWSFKQCGSVVCSFFVPNNNSQNSSQNQNNKGQVERNEKVIEQLEMALIELLNENEEYQVETVDHSDSDDASLVPYTEIRVVVLTEPAKVHDLNRLLSGGDFLLSEHLKQECNVARTDSEMSVIYHPTMYVDVAKQEDTEDLLEIVSTLEDDDDVVNVFHNARFVD